MSYARSLAVLFAIVAGGAISATADEKPVEIPLKQIWSNAAAEARSLRDLEPELLINRDTPEEIKKYSSSEALAEAVEKAKGSLVIQIEKALGKLPVRSEKPLPGFVVLGVDRAALQGVYDVLVKGTKPKQTFAEGDVTSIVFFSRPSQPRVFIERIERRGNVVTIHYLLISHGHLDLKPRIAIIPLGKLPAGKYRVEMSRSPNEAKHNQRGFPPVGANAERQIICAPFDFTVEAADVTKVD